MAAASRVIFLISLVFLMQCAPKEHYRYETPQQGDGLQTGSLADAEIDSTQIINLTNEILTGQYNIHSLLLLRDNKLVYENYFTGRDEIFANSMGEVPHNKDSLHDCRSVTKSVISACIGIAIEQKLIRSVDDSVFSYLTKYQAYALGSRRNVTIKHLLTMSAGIAWNERVPYSDSTNSELRMLASGDPIAFVLSQPRENEPGMSWNYSGGCTQLLAAILESVSGERVDVFANHNLFEPLGIQAYAWYKRADGTCWAPSGLRLRSRDIAKFGLLYLNGGRYNEKQIIPPDWVVESLKDQIKQGQEGYGYQFWCSWGSAAGKRVSVVQAIGFGGQRICLIPALRVSIIVTAGNYNELSDLPDKMISTFILPAIK